MRLGEECPYITPCGWCSRQGKPCEKINRRKRGEPIPELTIEEARARGFIIDEQETEELKLPPLLEQEVKAVNNLAELCKALNELPLSGSSDT